MVESHASPRGSTRPPVTSPSISKLLNAKYASSTRSDTVQDAEFASKKWVWLPDDKLGFIKGFVVSESDDKLKVRCSDDSDRTVAAGSVEKVNPPQFDKADDMAELTFLNEASVVHNLFSRYTADSIYTFSGLFLVAVNPYKSLPIYDAETIESYKNKSRDEVQPHIYSVTDLAFRNMLETFENQSILVTGESGAGKTENTKKVIQYLAGITSESRMSQRNRSSNGPAFEQQILQANPILEAFGNAQTVRNNNSSRFGKFIRIEFSKSGQISGASIDWYLLEKSRVIYQNPKERNYHIFYQLIRGSPAELKEALLLERDVSSYSYLKGSNKNIASVDDKEEFKNLMTSFKIMGLSTQEVNDILRVISAILHIGNIELGSESTDQGRLLDISQAERVCHLLGINSDQFIRGMLKPRVRAGREWVQQSRSAQQVRHSLDALAKSLYERIFSTIVDRINQTLEGSNDNTSFIGVLDIAGFEIFQNNSFEQLCINYTNEKLQQFFNHHMFVLEQEEYTRENIEWKYIDFGHDLQPTIDLIEKSNPMGIFSCLDEDCVMPKATDTSFTEKLNQLWTDKSAKYKPTKLSQGFILTHYAAEVEYSTDGWLEKNKDPLNDNVVQLLVESSEELVRNIFKAEAAASQNAASSGAQKRVKKGLFRTAAQRHKEQLTHLMTELNSTHPHFVRCIIPNHNKEPKKFDNLLVLDQLRCNGVLEGIRIARSGYPNRLFFSEFRSRYEVLVSNMPKGYVEGQKACILILKNLGLDPDLYKVGLTKLFFKSGVLAELEERREAMVRDLITRFQSTARGHLQRVKVRKELFKSQAANVIKKNLLVYAQLKDNPWWKLYVRTRPLLVASRETGQSKIRDAQVKKLEEAVKKHELDKTDIEERRRKLEHELERLTKLLEGERLLALDKEEILKRAQQKETELEDQLNSAVDDLDKLEVQCEELLDAKKKADSQADLWKKELENGAHLITMLEKEKSDLKERIAQLESELEKLSSQRADSTTEAAKLSQEVKFLTGCVADKDKKLAEMKDRLQKSDSELEATMKQAKSQNDSAGARIQNLVRENKDIRTQLDELCNSSADYEKLIRKKESEIQALQADMSKHQSRVASVDKEKSELQSKYDNISTELDSVLKDIAELRKSHSNLEREVSESRKLLEERISENIKQGEGRQLLDTQLQQLQVKVAQQQESLSVERSRFNGELKAKQDLIETLERDKAKLTASNKSLHVSHEEKLSLMKELELEKARATEVKKLRMEIGTLNNRLKRADQSKEDAIASVKGIEMKLQETNGRAAQLQKDHTSLNSEKNSLHSTISGLKRELEDHAHKSESMHIQHTRSIKELDTVNRQVSELTMERQKLQDELALKARQLEKLRDSILSEVEQRVSNVVEEKKSLESSEKQARVQVDTLTVENSKLQMQRDKMSQEIEDLNHRLANEKKAAMTAERLRASAQEELAAIKGNALNEKTSRSEAEMVKRKLTTSLSSITKKLQEREKQLLALQKAINPKSRSSDLDWNDVDKNIPGQVDLATRLEDSEKARRKAEEERSLLQEQLNAAKKRWSQDVQEKDSSYYAQRRALLEDLASVSSPATSPQKLPLRSSGSTNFDAPPQPVFSRDRTVVNKENLGGADETDLSGKSKEDLEESYHRLQASKRDLLAVYHETSNNLVKTKEQLADAQQAKTRVERELKSLQSNPGMTRSDSGTKLTEVMIRLDAELSRNTDLNESIRLYKTRADEYYGRLESAEAIVIKATRAEQFAKAQCAEAETALGRAVSERQNAERSATELMGRVDTLEADLEDKNIELQHSKQLQDRMAKELKEVHSRWSTELNSSQSSLDAMRARYGDEIRSLSGDLESQKQRFNTLSRETRDLERQVEELRKDHGSVSAEEKSKLQAQIEELTRNNEEASLAYQDSQKRMGSLLSQVRTLRTTMDEITADRDQLQKDKRTLERRLAELSKEFEELAMQESSRQRQTGGHNGGSSNSTEEVRDLKTALQRQTEASSEVLTRLRAAKEQLKQDHVAIEKERRVNEELQKQIEVYDKERKELHLKVLELETQSIGPKADESRLLRQKLADLESHLESQEKRHAEELRVTRSADRSVRDLYNQINIKDKTVARLEDERKQSETRLQMLKESLDSLEAESTSHRLAARRSEREARDTKERSLRLEKELEDWKSRFESLTSTRIPQAEARRFL